VSTLAHPHPAHPAPQPLPFDTSYNPKPAYYELVAVFQAHAEAKRAAQAQAAQAAEQAVGGALRGGAV
jgi:hypothetical protein